MEKLNLKQIEQFLKIDREVVCSADGGGHFNAEHPRGDIRNAGTGVTITTTMTTVNQHANYRIGS